MRAEERFTIPSRAANSSWSSLLSGLTSATRRVVTAALARSGSGVARTATSAMAAATAAIPRLVSTPKTSRPGPQLLFARARLWAWLVRLAQA